MKGKLLALLKEPLTWICVFVIPLIIYVIFFVEYPTAYVFVGIWIILTRIFGKSLTIAKGKKLWKKSTQILPIVLFLTTISIFLIFPISERIVDFQYKSHLAKLEAEREDNVEKKAMWEETEERHLIRMKFSIGAAMINGLCIFYSIISLLFRNKALKYEYVYGLILLLGSLGSLFWAIWGFPFFL